VSAKKGPRRVGGSSRGEHRRDQRAEPRVRWRGPLARPPRPWRADADVASPAGRGKLQRPHQERY
jgi:hypothetical protein